MKTSAADIEIPTLQEAYQPIAPTDTISAAGRKLILGELIEVRRHEDKVQAGDDHDAVHDMRVATRRARSALRLLGSYYRRKEVKRLASGLKATADALGAVRDFDVLLIDLRGRKDESLAEAITALESTRAKAHNALTDYIDGKDYKAGLGKLAAFATGPDALRDVEPPAPVQVRHVVPVLLHEQLAAVRGFDPMFDGDEQPDYETLHELRITFKRLRYATHFFRDVLGSAVDPFITDLKAIQDHLGRLNDVVVFGQALGKLRGKLDAPEQVDTTLTAYSAEAEAQAAGFKAVWHKFNSRAVQKHLADALLVLR
ncbi:MAG: CHAD domain-containing protein [Anaerolineae bacterium]|jgi:CHAD domain-containing protein|nr:CHAD domain-containing protein [Anaerolineae bacterium]